MQAAPLTAEEQSTVSKRGVLGLLAGVAAVAFAFVPNDALYVSKPTNPMYFYLVPLLRVADILRDLQPAVADAEFAQVRCHVISLLIPSLP